MHKPLLRVFAAGTWLFWPTLLPAGDVPAASEPQNSALFDRLDVNRDGQVTAGEVPEDKQRLFQRLLRAADKDGSGGLSRDEFLAGLQERRPERPLDQKSSGGLGGPAGLPDPEQLFSRLDANGDGKVTLEEVPEETRDKFQQLLIRADKNGDGALTKEEMTEGIHSFASDIKSAFAQAREPAQMFKYLDTDGDGKISADEVPEGRRPMFERLQARFDKDGDGKLSEAEFVAGMRVVQALQGKQPESDPAASDAAPVENTASGKPGKKPFSRPAGAGLPDPDKMLQRLMKMDQNNDGKISRAEVAGPFAERFDKFDANRDGFVDEAEIRNRLAQIKAHLNRAKSTVPQPAKPDGQP